jgi:FkbM family methyltransferase
MVIGDSGERRPARQLLKLVHLGYIGARRLTDRVLRKMPGVDLAVRGTLRRLTIPIESELAALALPPVVEIDGIRMAYEKADVRIVSRLVSGHYEPELRACIRARVDAGSTVVDCGAHVGWYALTMARLVGESGHVHAFEASPRTAATLRRNVELNGGSNVTVVEKAVTDTQGVVNIVTSATSSGINSIFGKPSSTSVVSAVESTSLDQYFAGLGWPKVDFAKIDVEGAEKLAVLGMRELIQRNPRMELVVEVNPVSATLEELIETLRSVGFRRLHALELGRDLETKEDLGMLVEASRIAAPNLLCLRS